MAKLAVFVLPILLLLQTNASSFPTRDLTRDEAIKLAEAAILRNGCTDLAPIKDRRQVPADRVKADLGFLFKHELDCHAIRAWEGRVDGKPVWIIGFELRHTCPECTELRHRLVLMNKDGTHLRLESRKTRINEILKDNR